MKTCTKCGITKSLPEFKLQKRKTGYFPTSWCRACSNEVARNYERRRAHFKRFDRMLVTYERPSRPPPLTRDEIRRRYVDRDPERAKAHARRYYQSERGRLQHRLQESKRRANMNGGLTAEQWKKIVAAWSGKCAYCHAENVELTIDHLVPVMRGGPHVASNVVPACLSCNSKKNARPLAEHLARIGASPLRFAARLHFARRIAEAA